MTRVVLTGAATMIGAEVLKELLRSTELTSLQLLLPKRAAAERLPAFVGWFPASVRIVEARQDLEQFDVVIHCAQRETQDHDLEAARQANVLPVEQWIHVLERNPAMRLHHLSTAFVAGTRRGLFTEFDLDCAQGFNNASKRSKYEA